MVVVAEMQYKQRLVYRGDTLHNFSVGGTAAAMKMHLAPKLLKSLKVNIFSFLLSTFTKRSTDYSTVAAAERNICGYDYGKLW